jgi:hypothetical protein
LKACTYCGAWIPDDSRVCSACNAIQDAAAAAPGPGGGASPPPSPSPVPAAPLPGNAAERRVKLLGTLYIVLGSLLLLTVAYSFVNVASGQFDRSLEEIQRQGDPRFKDLMKQVAEIVRQPWYLAVTHLVPFALGALYVWSGSRLRGLRGRGAAIGAAVAMIVLSPLEGQCCCCMFALPLGVFALVSLTRADVVALLDAPKP